MKKCKSILLLSLSLVLLSFALTACGDDANNNDGSIGTTTQTDNNTDNNNKNDNTNGDGIINDAEDAVDDVGNGVEDVVDGVGEGVDDMLTGDDNDKSNTTTEKR